MDFLTQILHLVGSGATAYISARNMRDLQTRPNTLAALQMAEAGSVPFLEALRDRATAEGDLWLAERLQKHANDERRHAQIFANGLKQLNKQVIDFKNVPQTATDGTPDERRRSPFFETYFDGYSSEDMKPANIDWVVFIASTYILELDASKDFVKMANALPDDAQSANLKKGILSVAQDETRHAAYLREALERRLPIAEANAVLDEWRTRKVNALLAMVSNFVQKGGKLPNLAQEGTPAEAAKTELEMAV
ncbi:MAG: ferritin-like domain-containing protein [Oscillatoriales cyanobacterium C42_A2020_001]|nr:ferritin-like domain-containing protein [Leptolyngbyaceae cyanobacterium C42_A2020_001]